MNVFFSFDQRVGVSKLPEKMTIRCGDQWFFKPNRRIHGFFVEVDEAVVVLGKFDRIKKMNIFQQVGLQRFEFMKERMRSDD